ncbi:MAG: ankyrin repeat domain-containing protein [Nitrospirota bacterium]|nr:ankyrin repeat domain-containing protein [Nitrospirota bacterium]
MDSMKTDISPRYYIAETTVWLLSAILTVSRFVGLDPSQSLPLLNLNLKNPQHYLRIVAVLLIVATFYLILEWKQSSPEARRSYYAKVRAGLATLLTCASLWLSYPLIAEKTRFAGTSPAWYLGFLVIGYLLGTAVSILALASLMIRQPLEARMLQLPRIPAATRAQYKVWIPAVPVLIVMYYVLSYFAPDVIKGLGFVFVAVFFIFAIGDEFASLCLHRDENGKRIPYSRRISILKEVFDSHDYSYYLIDHGMKAIEEFDIPIKESPEAIQKAMQEKFSTKSSTGLIRFHAQTQEEVKLKFYFKDGNENNLSPENRGVKILKHQGRKGFICVILIPDEPARKSVKFEVSTSLIEMNAEEYFSTHTDAADLTLEKVFLNAVDQAVMQTMLQQSGPLLQKAVLTGQEDRVVALLKQDVDVNERAEAGWTPLLHAAAQGYPRIARLLLDAGANTDIGNLHGITPLMYSARYGNVDVCRILLEYGANPDLQDVYGWTALMVSARIGSADVAEMLIKTGAGINITDRNAMTALDFAYKYKQGKIAKMIRNANRRNQATR